MSRVLIAEGLGYNLLSVSQLMAKGIHLESDSTTQEFKIYHGKGGLYIGKAILKNNVFVLDFVPDQGTADSDAIVNFASWTPPPDLDPDFSPGGFWSRVNIGSSNNTYDTNRGFFNGTSSNRRYSTDSCAAVDSHSTRYPQKRQPHRRILFQLRPIQALTRTSRKRITRFTLQTYLDNLAADRDLTGGFRGNRAFASAADEADWDEQNVDGASEEAGPLSYCSVDIPMDDDNPRESVNAEVYFDFADNCYVTPQPVDTNVSKRIGPNFLPDPEAGDEAAYPEDASLPHYT
ncbi:unnamed protein product [Closterium sp. NIES-53]